MTLKYATSRRNYYVKALKVLKNSFQYQEHNAMDTKQTQKDIDDFEKELASWQQQITNLSL